MSVSKESNRTRLTYDDYLLIPDDGNRHEIIDGRHYMNAAPNPVHQLISRHIQFQLMEQLEFTGLADVFNAPADVYFDHFNVVQPDLVVVLKSRPIISKTKIEGVPDLVVEILSPSTRALDLKLKRTLFEKFGVPEYWIVDPDACSVDQLIYGDDKQYRLAASCREQIQLQLEAVTAVVDLSRIWKLLV